MTPHATQKRASRKKTSRHYFRRFKGYLTKCHWCGSRLVWMSRVPKENRIHFEPSKFRLTFRDKKDILTLRVASLDHVTPLSEGGSGELSNITVACVPCNKDRLDRRDHILTCQRCGCLKRGRKPYCKSCRIYNGHAHQLKAMRFSVHLGRS